MNQRRLIHFASIQTLAPLCGGRGSAARSGRSVGVCATCLELMTASISAAPVTRRADARSPGTDRARLDGSRMRAGLEPVDA